MATDVLRPHTAMGYVSRSPQQYVDTDTKLGNDNLTGGFRRHLEDFYQQANTQDRARCLELLTSIDLSKAIRDHAKGRDITYPIPPTPPSRARRPKTAMATVGHDYKCAEYVHPDSYGTTYSREYKGEYGYPGNADRPSSLRAFHASYELQDPIGNTSYDNDYCMKQPKKTTPTRTGSSSGNRRNNPHPLESFMKWRLPCNPKEEQPYSEWATELTDEVMDRVCRGKIKSTYQQDYLGIPQGHQMKSAFESCEDWRTRIPYSLDSSMRHSYQQPEMKTQLKGNNTRYGCNKLKNEPANGVVPTVHRRPHMNIIARTTYEREYVDPIHGGPRNVRQLGREMGANALMKHYRAAEGAEKEKLRQMLESMHVNPPTGSKPPSGASSRTSMRYKPVVPAATSLHSPPPPSMGY